MVDVNRVSSDGELSAGNAIIIAFVVGRPTGHRNPRAGDGSGQIVICARCQIQVWPNQTLC